MLDDVLIMIFVNGEWTCINSPTSLPKNPRNYTILEICVFDKFTLPEEFYAKTLKCFETCQTNGNVFGGISSVVLPITFDDSLRVTHSEFFCGTF